MNLSSAAINWSPEQYKNFGVEPQITPHSYHQLPWFTDQALIDLMDRYPRENLQAHTMGVDPERYQDWVQVNINAKTTGKEILEAVGKGRLWINLTHIENFERDYAELIDGMYGHLSAHCTHLDKPTPTHSALLISSPGVQVYYHVDAEPNMIWHLRGQKHIWMYPAMNMDIIAQDFLEDIYAGEIDEDLPYKPEFDKLAVRALLNPGDAASWPHNAPHRIQNVGLNVSLATSYSTIDTHKRQYVQLANRFILRNLGIKNRSIDETGFLSVLKQTTYRAINRIRPFKRRAVANYLTNLEIDASSPTGMRTLSKSTLPVFARKAEEFELSASDQRAA